jgi:ligand-binding sensor domain-containing protein
MIILSAPFRKIKQASSNDGISRWNSKKQLFENYNHHDGIPAGNFIEGSACSTEDGILYFGSLNGVCYFDPKELITEHQVAPVQQTDRKPQRRSFNSYN